MPTFLQGCNGLLELKGQKLPPKGSPALYTLSYTVEGRAGMMTFGSLSRSCWYSQVVCAMDPCKSQMMLQS